ncbi:BgtA-21104 [Blumeria graminis f. sp. tritici]|uniref:BgtA-21104 n=2 Tax=Blumeria graminis f. sp. tritici TaxID=62690 RepID=A0A9X9MP73_BLUGR|nr:hypothetical protein BGT96224_A21104 [Blumeria graminis f. sp. tritici 96224]VDB94896.1 BgtA-21104 [Blumeria graminis f. sp. tritici]
MFSSSEPSAASQPSQVDSSSPTRSRLRPLSYLRTYRQNYHQQQQQQQQLQNHHNNAYTNGHQGSSRTSVTRSSNNFSSDAPRLDPIITNFISNSSGFLENSGATSGWLPTVGGQSGVSRIATEPQATATASSSALLSNHSALVESPEPAFSMPRSLLVTPSAAVTNNIAPENISDVLAREDTTLPSSANPATSSQGMAHKPPSIRLSAYQDPRAIRPSLIFTPMSRVLPSENDVIKVGRYSERDLHPIQASNMPSSAPIGFKSKVVSRRHCEFWYSDGRWLIKDVKSSSGTFLNHIRLSAPGVESKPYPIHDGDIVQLGIDFKGGEEMIFRCVKIRIELNKGWQMGPSSYNMQSHKRLRELNNPGQPACRTSQDCSICLGPIAPCQSLFVAPCSHTWHYKCIRIIINGPYWPNFTCPNCRTVADLEAEIEDTRGDEWEEAKVEEVSLPADKEVSNPPIDPPQLRTRHDNIESTAHKRPISPFHPTTTASIPDSNLNRSVAEVSITAPAISVEMAVQPTSNKAFQQSTEAAVGSVTASLSNQSPIPTVDPHRTNSLQPSLTPSHELITPIEGPMTPRNHVGPYVFDGSDSCRRTMVVPPMNLDAVATDSPPSRPSSTQSS